MNNNQKTFAYYCDTFAKQMREGLRISEAETTTNYATSASPDERLAQCIWYDSMFLHGKTCTDSGQTLEIIRPGVWNHEAGPDFIGAKLRLGKKLIEGDIEIHLNAAGWNQHRHFRDPNYDRVVLHAYLWKQAKKPQNPQTSQGCVIENFCMEKFLFPDFDSICQTVHIEDYPYRAPSSLGECHEKMCSLDEGFIGGLLDSAGRARLLTKTARFSDQAAGANADQVFYQALMMAMGHKASKGLFFLLSKRVPLAEMLDYLADVHPQATAQQAQLFFESMLMHVAQLIPDEDEELDDESAAHVEKLRQEWLPFADYFADRIIPVSKQWTSGVRPVNFAHRRIGGIAFILSRWFLHQSVAPQFAQLISEFDPNLSTRKRTQWIRNQLSAAFLINAEDSYWGWRYNYSARRSARALKVIGQSRADSIALNALLPMLLHHAEKTRDKKLEQSVWQVFSIFPALQINSMVRHMRSRVFGEHPRGNSMLKTENRQQGLFQLFAFCCKENVSGCENCYYLKGSTNK